MSKCLRCGEESVDCKSHVVEPLYYVQDTRQMVGNCVLWWGIDNKGYTTQLDTAGLYTSKQVRGMRDTDIGWPREYVEKHIVKHVRRDNLRHNEHTVELIKGK